MLGTERPSIPHSEIESLDNESFPKIVREISPDELVKLSPEGYTDDQGIRVPGYQILQNAQKRFVKRQGDARYAASEVMGDTIPIRQYETQMIEDTDALVGILDGSYKSESGTSKHYLEGKPLSQDPIDTAFFLDKSARPVSHLVRQTWSILSAAQMPEFRYINIDKKPYLSRMGYDEANGDNLDNVPLSEISLDKLDQNIRRDLVTRLRAMYVLPSQRTLVDLNGDEVWDMPTLLDGKHVAVIDEVKSSGATLHLATLLFREAFPEAVIDGVFWSTPPRVEWWAKDEKSGKERKEFTVDVPPWYQHEDQTGRWVFDVDEEYNQESKNWVQRTGYDFISSPHKAENPDDGAWQKLPTDDKSKKLQHDLQLLSDRFKAGLIEYVPDGELDFEIVKKKIESYYGISYNEWLSLRRGENGQTLSDFLNKRAASVAK